MTLIFEKDDYIILIDKDVTPTTKSTHKLF